MRDFENNNTKVNVFFTSKLKSSYTFNDRIWKRRNASGCNVLQI